MARKKNNPVSISTLRAVMLIYSAFRGLRPSNSWPDNNIPDTRYVTAVADKLDADNIVKGASRSFVNKLLGYPGQSTPGESDSIDPQKLEALAAVILNDTQFPKNIFSETPTHGTFWKTVSSLFTLPEYLQYIEQLGYYKFLSENQRRLVDGFILRKIYQYNLDPAAGTYTYAVILWSHVDKNVRTAILQINLQLNVAFYTIYAKGPGGLLPKAVMSSGLKGGYFCRSSTLEMSLVDENPSSNIRATFLINISEIAFTHLDYLKSLLIFSAFNLKTPTSCSVILKKCLNYNEAFELASNRDKIDPKIVFDVLMQRDEVKDDSLESLNKLNSHKIFRVADWVKGAYRVFFVSETNISNKLNEVTQGWCFIEPTGLISFKFMPNREVQGYIDNLNYTGEDSLIIRTFNESNLAELQWDHRLKVNRDTRKNSVILLYGGYVSHYQAVPLVGKIVYIKDEEIKSKAGFNDKDLIVMSKVEAKNHPAYGKYLKEFLDLREYDANKDDEKK